MNTFSKECTIRWSDLDPNFHVRHSVYYDWGAYCRIAFFNETGLTPNVMAHEHIGPIIFREECLFKKEIKFGDSLQINFVVSQCRADFSRWTILHEIWKDRSILCAFLTVEGAWIDTQVRKLTVPVGPVLNVLEMAPKSPGFRFVEKK